MRRKHLRDGSCLNACTSPLASLPPPDRPLDLLEVESTTTTTTVNKEVMPRRLARLPTSAALLPCRLAPTTAAVMHHPPVPRRLATVAATSHLVRVHIFSYALSLIILGCPAGPPPPPPSQQQNYGPSFQGADNRQHQLSYQYSQCTGKKKALTVRVF